MCAFEVIWNLILDDIRDSSLAAKEFMPTKTSQAIARAIWDLQTSPDQPLSGVRALDVGTGTGVHALTMAARGYGHVTAIDSSVGAVEFARKRWVRLRKRVVCDSDIGSGPEIRFVAETLDSFRPPAPLSLITFNPTAYFDFLDTRHESPVSEAVYVDDDWRNGNLAESSALYRFFENVVFPNLKVGGSVICTWFGLERRLVGCGQGTPPSQIVHPVRTLQRWFPELDFEGDLSPGMDFYAENAQITSDYGLGASFKENLILGYKAGLYSNLFSLGDRLTRPQFRFGVLHLVRTGVAPALQFRIGTVPADSPEKGELGRVTTSPNRPHGYA